MEQLYADADADDVCVDVRVASPGVDASAPVRAFASSSSVSSSFLCSSFVFVFARRAVMNLIDDLKP